MIKSLIFSSILFLSLSASLLGQHKCGFDDMVNGNPELKEALIQEAQQFNHTYKKNRLRRDFTFSYDTTYIIPVVVHVVYNNALQNIPDSCILSQIQVLNEDFNHTNPDTGNLRDEFKPVAGKLNFKFVLATKDPNGAVHSGIIRKQTSVASFSQTSGGQYDTRMKFDVTGGSSAWDPDKYLNIWVCNIFSTASPLLGYATPPTGADNWPGNVQFPKAQQGAVVHYYTVGRYNPRATSNGAFSLGRTCTHELGHYFGLFHTWGLQTNTCSPSIDDFIDDTPNSASPNSGCSKNRNSCELTSPGDLPDMVENYMDYSRGNCQNTFTQQQCAMMLHNLKKYRSDLAQLELAKDSTFAGQVNPQPILYANPGNILTIAADVYTTNEFSVTIYNNLGQQLLKDYPIIIDKPVAIESSSSFNYGHYFIKITNKTNGEEKILKWSNISLF